MTYPSGRTVTYTYDDSGRPTKVDGTIGDGTARTFVEGIEYNSFGAIKQEKLGTITPLYHKQQFNSRGQLEAIRLSTTQSPLDGDRGAIFNFYGSVTTNNGNLTRQEIYTPGPNYYQQNYTYDLLNRLFSVTEKQNGGGNDSFNQTYSYDRYGNRTISASATFNAPEPQFDTSSTSNRIFSPGENTGVACNDTSTSRLMCYDAAGNLIRDKHVTNAAWMAYDGEGKMVTHNSNDALSDTVYYLYDADGKRKQTIITADNPQNYIYGIGGELLGEATSTKIKKEYAYRNGQMLISITNPGRYQTADLRWMIPDHLGTPRIVVDKTGDLSAIKRHDYLPFGEEIGPTIGGRSTGQGYGSPQADGVRQQFTGYERDLESGLDFAQARYMGSSLGRFTSPDPLASSASPGDPQSWNRYPYALNNSLRFTDPTGLAPCPPCNEGETVIDSDGNERVWTNNIFANPGATSYGIVDVVSDGVADVVNLAGRYVQSASDLFSYGFGRAQTEYQTGQPQEGPRIFGNQGPTSSEVLDQTMQSYQAAAQIAEVGFQLQMIPFAAAAAAGGGSPVAAYRGNSVSGVADDFLAPVDLPSQNHHFATIRNQRFTPEMAEIANEFGLSLKGSWNTQMLPHLGRHPNAYHEFVLTGMQNARNGANGSQAEFLRLFDLYVRQPVVQNPQLLRRAGW